MLGSELAQRIALERGLLLTFRDLTISPGRMIRSYIEGSRRRYVGPIGYFLLSAAAMLFTLPLYQELMNDWMRGRLGSVGGGETSRLSAEQTEALTRISIAMTEATTLGGFAMCLPFAFFIWLLFRRTGINLTEATVFALYAFGHAFLLFSLAVPVMWAFDGGFRVYSYGTMLTLLLYPTFAAGKLFGATVGVVVRTLIAFAASYAVWMVVFTAAALLYVLTFV